MAEAMNANHLNSNQNDEPEEDAGPEIVSAFPKPPKWFPLYKNGLNDPNAPTPPVPMEPKYHMFGTPYCTKDTVPDLIPPEKKLYNKENEAGGDPKVACNFKKELKRLNYSLLANFTELVDILIVNPALFKEKLNDLELLFLNMHNVVNSYRPHQARETLIDMLKTQIEENQNARREIEEYLIESSAKVKEAHEQLQSVLDENEDFDRELEEGVTEDDVKRENSAPMDVDEPLSPDKGAAMLMDSSMRSTFKELQSLVNSDQST